MTGKSKKKNGITKFPKQLTEKFKGPIEIEGKRKREELGKINSEKKSSEL